MAEPAEPAARNENVAYEHSDWHLGAIGLSFLGIFAFLVVAPLALIWVFPTSVSDVGRNRTVEPPTPRLQIDPAGDLARFREDESRRLETYYWIDREKGIVHLPIEQAMRKLAEEGIDGFPKAPR
jgi:hypothetical protein